MPLQLPLVPAIPNYRVGTTLDGEPYVLDVRWNGRAAAWYLDILDVDETPIEQGIKLVLGAALGSRTLNPARLRGLLRVSDLTGAGREATFDDMGERVIVYYYTPAELEALDAEGDT
jgi:hypothetical protein